MLILTSSIKAVGCEDQTVRIISLDPETTLETISLQALTAPPSSICIADMLDASINKTQPTMFVNIGLQNGVLLRTVLDPVNGQLTDTRTRYVIYNCTSDSHLNISMLLDISDSLEPGPSA